MTPEALMAARAALDVTEAGELVHLLAQELLDSFQAVRRYLQAVAQCLERVDPHLHNNPGLIACLDDLDRVWQMNRRYVQKKAMRDGLSHAAEAVAQAQSMVPRLTQMCLDCDPEFFMVLPRLLWLGFLKDPRYEMLLRSLVPNYFSQDDLEPSAEKRDTKLHKLIEHFNATQRLLVEAQRPKTKQAQETARSAAWEILMHRVG